MQLIGIKPFLVHLTITDNPSIGRFVPSILVENWPTVIVPELLKMLWQHRCLAIFSTNKDVTGYIIYILKPQNFVTSDEYINFSSIVFNLQNVTAWLVLLKHKFLLSVIYKNARKAENRARLCSNHGLSIHSALKAACYYDDRTSEKQGLT